MFRRTQADEYVRPPPRPLVLTAQNKPPNYPQQVHISSVGSKHMRISWVTDDRRTASAPSVVEYGTSPGNYTASAEGSHTTYRCSSYYSSGAIHEVTIGPLKPSTTYYYRCGKVGDGDADMSLRTPLANLPIELVVIGDLGQTGWTKSTLSHIRDADYDMLLLPGDLSYADRVQPLWDSFGRLVQPLASARPWMVTEGNHENEHEDGFVAYNNRWRMPHEESGSKSNLYYSFDAAGGAVHVLMLGSYASFQEGSEQHAWLKRDLAGVDRQRTPWLVVLLHAPWYNTNEAHQDEEVGESMRTAMERLLYEANVDVVFAGHVHAYERFTRIYDNKADARGPVYITIGDGGNREGLASKFIKDHKSAPLSLFREASFGHGRLRIVNETTAVWRWHRNDDKFATVADEVWLESLATPNTPTKRRSLHR
ncbi:purple acid phosphatase 22-like [Hordeum vulgare subsp. vulgare]|uniref:Purple acid phosphatase n=1 Tax=Hordeum vulgare subsp. vulgare TaxID=112509 RepID=A0A287JUN2_HORVV|nr:purple acid phosphatase 22-like [Hordeum vulgare subsp. vulgare]